MNKRFTFGKNTIPIDIEDLHFEVPFSQDIFKKKEKLISEAEKTAAKLNEDIDDEEVFDRAFSFFKGAIDGLLGGGAHDQIFEGRARDFIEQADVLFFVIGQISAYETNRYRAYNTQSAPNLQLQTQPKKKRKRR